MSYFISALLGAIAVALASLPVTAAAQDFRPPEPRLLELIGEARRLAAMADDADWPGLPGASFGVLLVEADQETLFCHPGAAPGFAPLGRDPASQCEIQARARVFPPDLLASFPAVDNRATIVIGTPDATGRSEIDWVLTILHEHFHQYQYEGDGYYAALDGLGLSGGDSSGQWVLDYPFPYDDAQTGRAFAALAADLRAALLARGTPEFAAAAAAYWTRRRALPAALSEADHRYFGLQEWQEGGARFAQYFFAAKAANADGGVFGPPEYAHAHGRQIEALIAALSAADLAEDRRVLFYALGAGAALLLERDCPGWKERYRAGARFDLPSAACDSR